MFRFFERLLPPTDTPPDAPPPALGEGQALLRFYWHYVRQARGLVAALFLTGLLVAGLDSLVPVLFGRVVTLVSTYRPERLLAEAGWQLAGMAAVLLVLRPVALLAQYLVTNQGIAANLTNLIRWQAHWHVVRQSWTFFQNDFAGRIANRVMQVGPALRESVVSATNAIWYIVVYGTSAIAVLLGVNWRLAIPTACWFCGYGLLLRLFVPRMRERSRATSEARSTLTGRIVDGYTNILTVKLFAASRDEDRFVRDSVDTHTGVFAHQLRLTTGFTVSLTLLNAVHVASVGTVALVLWAQGAISVGIVAMALPLAWQISQMSGWVAQNATSIFENVGLVQDSMRSVAVQRQHPDAPDAKPLSMSRGRVRFEKVWFGYGTERGVLHELSLDIAAGERVGLVGHSGAGKSTLVNLLLGFYAVEGGRITIDGQDVARVTQESLRQRIAVVTQDTSLLHRSISENIRYGRPDATDAEVLAAAREAAALEFIEQLEDWHGRRGFDAHVGERGVKLSGGQRQRIAIARVILKDAPILVLDEATSALDSEVEAVIQASLDRLMRGRTVLAIAHRLSTIARMDRLAVMEHGRIIELGSHTALLAQGGAYAKLWHRQSGGFLQEASFAA